MGVRCLTLTVMAGLDPAIRVFLPTKAKSWTPGTSPGVTAATPVFWIPGSLASLAPWNDGETA